jgi:hypothetical protein
LPVLKIPKNINSFQLAKILNREPLEVLKHAQDISNDICTNEFQILSDEAIELVCLELEIEIELIA